MSVAGAELIGATVVVEGELQFLLLSRQPVEEVGGLKLAVPDDWQLSAEFETERLMEGKAPLRVIIRYIVWR
jgi:hypothetical protein